jgi:DNA polymerase V
LEVYSIDEAFLSLHGMEKWYGSLESYARQLRADMRQRTHVSTCIGPGITTAAALARCSEAMARKHLGGVVGARLVRELQG